MVASFNVVYRISVTVTGNNGAVSYTQSTGTPQLTVSSTGLVVRI